MLSARVSSARRASRIARGFASVVDSAGLKVAVADNGQPTATVTLAVKAGSRYETKPGVAHVLKNFAFKSTDKRSSLATIREAELYGGVLTTSLTREHIAITAQFLRGDEAFFVDLLASQITSPRFTRYELEESVLPTVAQEVAAATADPATQALELAHSLAFHSGLGSSLFAHHPEALTVEDVKAYAASTFASGISVVGTGIDQSVLVKLLEKHLPGSSPSSAVKSAASKYFGGETRAAASHGGPETVFIGYGTAAGSIGTAELAVLSAHLSGQTHVKWGRSAAPYASALSAGTSVQSVLLSYSDAALFGLLVQGPSAAKVEDAATAVLKALKEAGSVKGEELKRAIAKAKFAAAYSIEASGPGDLADASSVANTLKALDGVTEAALSKAASELIKAKPTYVAIGDSNLPYAAELGL